MTEEEKTKLKKAYFKEWRKNNPEKVKKAQEKFWFKKFTNSQKGEN